MITEVGADGKAIGTATGFFVSVPVGDGNQEKIVLISNKHVLCKSESIIVTFTKLENGLPQFGKKVTLPIANIRDNVVQHPDPNVDIAALVCTGLFIMFPNQLYFKAMSYDMLSDFTEADLSVAENIYFVGYPNGKYDEVNNLPLIRTGLISSNPKFDFDGLPCFIIDAQVFPGSSGSPVYIDYTFENIKNGSIVVTNQRNIKVLGIVARTFIRGSELKAVESSTTQYVEEIIGLGIVFKSTEIRKLIRIAVPDIVEKQ